jgi:ATP-dependent RNA helicase DHX8/PRP22
MARRLCEERRSRLGGEVGYSIRFEDRTSSQTRIRYVTDGILVRECSTDPGLGQYSLVILDEAHERSLHTDILFALVKAAVNARAGGLRLVVTSATLNTRLFSAYFGDCPVLQMHGKLFPVEVRYSLAGAPRRVEEAVRAALRMHLHEGPGDVLVFLTGSEECEYAKALCFERLQ